MINMPKTSRKKLSVAEAWLEAGLNILASSGPAFLSIENLTRETGKTKGSFYHHFRNRDRYVFDLLKFYEKKSTIGVITASMEGEDAPTRLGRLTDLAFQLPGRLELAFRAWALYHPAVKKYQEKIDQIRLLFLQNLYNSLIDDQDEAWMLAYKNYSCFLGLQQIRNQLSADNFNVSIKNIFQMPAKR